MTKPSILSPQAQALVELLGGHSPPMLWLTARKPLAGFPDAVRAEELSLVLPSGEPVRAFLAGPSGPWQKMPAVLYCHAHGNRYGIGASELIEGRPALLQEPYGIALARRGVVAFCIDMPCFGDRVGEGESALSKRCLWEGRTLFGRMLEELAGAFHLLSAMDGVDRDSISIFGFSMGATQAFWLGALQPHLRRIAHACAFADLAMLIETGAHDLHGPYMTVPGLTRVFRTGEIAAMAAPRPQLAVMGGLDPLTPPAALQRAVNDLRAGYAKTPEALHIHVERDVGHQETPAMRKAVLEFLTA